MAKHWFVTTANLCRGVGDRFFESVYDNKNGYDNKQSYRHLKKSQILSFVVLKNGIHLFMKKGSCGTDIGLVEIN